MKSCQKKLNMRNNGIIFQEFLPHAQIFYGRRVFDGLRKADVGWKYDRRKAEIKSVETLAFFIVHALQLLSNVMDQCCVVFFDGCTVSGKFIAETSVVLVNIQVNRHDVYRNFDIYAQLYALLQDIRGISIDQHICGTVRMCFCVVSPRNASDWNIWGSYHFRVASVLFPVSRTAFRLSFIA